MPSTSLKMDIKPPIDPLEPYKNFGLVFEKKLRNFEKRKVINLQKYQCFKINILNVIKRKSIQFYL